MRVSENFKESEFKCKCCGEVKVDSLLLEILEDVRKHFGKPVTINSGYRCKIHNKEVGSTELSQHRRGKASDITVKDTDPQLVTDYLISEHPHGLGIGRYESFTHVDTREWRARW
ncbi:MAG: DUF882 domain-containing protein [Helicobacteraceae bacterium]|nr:DUF882 domain-containing protein [Helicobacteraceae bacterium]